MGAGPARRQRAVERDDVAPGAYIDAGPRIAS